jgi:hypothetical protein
MSITSSLPVSVSDLLLLAHAGFGVAGCLAALWVLVETLNAHAGNAVRIRQASAVTAVCMAMAWICGGYWYVHYYPAEKLLILKGPWAFAHDIFMEVKEHLFFITGILAFLLPVATREALQSNAAARRLVVSVAGMIVISGLLVEGAGAIVDHGVKVALLRSAAP